MLEVEVKLSAMPFEAGGRSRVLYKEIHNEA